MERGIITHKCKAGTPYHNDVVDLEHVQWKLWRKLWRNEVACDPYRIQNTDISEMQIRESKTIYLHSEERLMILMIYYEDDELFKI